MMARVVLSLAVLSLAMRAAGAQMLPPISGPKNAAARVAAAANARTATQTDDPELAARARAQAAAVPQRGTAPTVAAKPNLTPPARPYKPATAAPGAAPARGAATTTPVAAGAIAPPTVGTVSVTARGAKSEVAFSREIFSYDQGGRRDPFLSLLLSGDLRPAMNDLRLVAVAYDPTGRNSVAIMRDVNTKDQYRAKVGQTLGRMRVTEIQPKMVVFSIEEFGMNRREELVLVRDSTRAR
jgi:hypothetical protein